MNNPNQKKNNCVIIFNNFLPNSYNLIVKKNRTFQYDTTKNIVLLLSELLLPKTSDLLNIKETQSYDNE